VRRVPIPPPTSASRPGVNTTKDSKGAPTVPGSPQLRSFAKARQAPLVPGMRYNGPAEALVITRASFNESDVMNRHRRSRVAAEPGE
jgi:hypothetical protein